MALPEAALRAFCVVVFETGPRTLTSYTAAWHQEIMQFAAGKYSREVLEKVFVAGRITEEQKSYIFSLMPALPESEKELEPTPIPEQEPESNESPEPEITETNEEEPATSEGGEETEEDEAP